MLGCCSLPKVRCSRVNSAPNCRAGPRNVSRKNLRRHTNSRSATRNRSWHCKGEQRVACTMLPGIQWPKGLICCRPEKVFTILCWCYAKHRREKNFRPATSRCRNVIPEMRGIKLHAQYCTSCSDKFCSLLLIARIQVGSGASVPQLVTAKIIKADLCATAAFTCSALPCACSPSLNLRQTKIHPSRPIYQLYRTGLASSELARCC